MSITIRCDQCGRSYSVKPEIVGRTVKCKGCAHTFLASAPPPEPELVELADLSELASYGAATAPAVDLAATPLSSQGAARRPQPASAGLPKPALIAIAVGAGAAGLLLLVVIVTAVIGGGDDPAPLAATGSPAAAASGGSQATNVSTGATLAVTRAADDGGPVAWSVVPDPAPPAKPLLTGSLPTGDLGELWFSRRDHGLALATRDDYSVPGVVVHAEKFDLATGGSQGQIQLPAKDRMLAFSADGRYVLAGSNGYEGTGFEQLRVWSWTGDAAQEAGSWVPYPNAKSYKTVWAAMPRADLILTLGGDKELIAWSFPNPQPRYTIKTADHKPPLLTPGGKYLAVHRQDGYRFYDVASGRAVGQTEPGSGLSYASAEVMHPQGDRVAALCPYQDSSSGWRAYVWDLKTGKLTVQADVSDPAQSHLQFCEPPFLLAGNTLIDMERNASVWKYRYSKPAPAPPDTRLWFAGAIGGESRVYLKTLPSQPEREKIDAAWSNASVVVPQGAALAVEASVPSDAPPSHNQQALVQKASQMLEEAGYRAAADQPQRLRVTIVEGGSGRTIEFRAMATSQVVAHVPDRHLETKVALVGADGKEVWTRTSSFGPMLVTRLDPGNTGDVAQKILRERWDRLGSWLNTVRIPHEIVSTMTDAGMGTTEIKPGA